MKIEYEKGDYKYVIDEESDNISIEYEGDALFRGFSIIMLFGDDRLSIGSSFYYMSAEYIDIRLRPRESTQEFALTLSIEAPNWNIDLTHIPVHLWHFINRGIKNGTLKVEDPEFDQLREEFSS